MVTLIIKIVLKSILVDKLNKAESIVKIEPLQVNIGRVNYFLVIPASVRAFHIRKSSFNN